MNRIRNAMIDRTSRKDPVWVCIAGSLPYRRAPIAYGGSGQARPGKADRLAEFAADRPCAPAAVTVLTSEVLQDSGVVDLRAAQKLVPSVRFQAEGASTEVYLRGVGSTLDLPNIEPPTTVNFNGIYIPREATSGPLFDVNRIEVLPGPQGTLYGRSVLGGAVNVEFNRPTRDLAKEFALEAGNRSLFHATVTQNLPVSDAFALRGAVDYINHDGYLRTGADSKDDYGVRLSGLYAPDDDLDVHVWVHTAEKNGHPANLVPKGYNGGSFDGSPHAFESNDPWNDVIAPGVPQAEDQAYEEWIVGAEVDWRIGDLSTGVRRPLHARGHHAQPTRGHRGVRAGDVRARRRLAHRRGRPLQLRPARGRRPRRATSSMKRHSRPSPSA